MSQYQQYEEFEKFKVGEYLLGFLFGIDFVVVIGGELGSGCFLCCLVDDHALWMTTAKFS